MPLFNESFEASHDNRHHKVMNFVLSLQDSLCRQIPVTSIEFNPPVVSTLAKQELAYWRLLEQPDEEDRTILANLREKLQGLSSCREIGSFTSVTDSAAGMLRMHNLTMVRLLADPVFTRRHLGADAFVWEPSRTIVHVTRNHNLPWLRHFIEECRALGFTQLLLITGDPLKEVRFRPVTAEQAQAMSEAEAAECRLKNSVEMLKFIGALAPDFYIGAAHNPFLKPEAAHKHLLHKVEAGARFLITQPVSYYDECWTVIHQFETFCRAAKVTVPVVLGVFNYSVPVGKNGFKEETFQKRYEFWKKLFGFVPSGVRRDYESGLSGTEILARSINKLKRMGYYHFDVMNAEKNGWSVLRKGQIFVHEQDRFLGSFDRHLG